MRELWHNTVVNNMSLKLEMVRSRSARKKSRLSRKRRSQMGGDVPVNYYLAAGKKLSDLLAVTGVSALLSTTAPAQAAGCTWAPVGSQKEGDNSIVKLNSLEKIGWNNNNIGTKIPDGTFMASRGLVNNGATDISTLPPTAAVGTDKTNLKLWSTMNTSNQIYFGGVNQSSDAKFNEFNFTHQFYISGLLADKTDLAAAMIEAVTNTYKSTVGAAADAKGVMPTTSKGWAVPLGSTTYTSDGTKLLLLCLTSGSGTNSMSQAVFQISDFTIDANKNIKIQWSPPESSKDAESYIGTLASSTGAANNSPYTVQLALCPVTAGKAITPPAQIASIIQ